MFTLKPDVIHLAAWLCSRVKFICRERGGLSGGLLPVLPDCRPVCGEPVRSGAGKGCYVQSDRMAVFNDAYEAAPASLAANPMKNIPTSVFPTADNLRFPFRRLSR